MARDKVIVFNGADGKCRVVIPTVDCALSDDAIISKDISASEYSLIDASDLPNTSFRSAFTFPCMLSTTKDTDFEFMLFAC